LRGCGNDTSHHYVGGCLSSDGHWLGETQGAQMSEVLKVLKETEAQAWANLMALPKDATKEEYDRLRRVWRLANDVYSLETAGRVKP
jgi:hypothetical protein